MIDVQNPMNCTTCHFNINDTCQIPLPIFMKIDAHVLEGGRQLTETIKSKKCDAFKPIKGTYKRICLNCGKPIRSAHKFTEIYPKQWIHKYCDHPESPSKYHYEKYHNRG